MSLVLALLSAAFAAPLIIPGEVILQEGDMPAGLGGAALTSFSQLSLNAQGQAGVLGENNFSGHQLWVDGAVVWASWDETTRNLGLGTSNTQHVGIGDAGEYVYRPVDGTLDLLWTHSGALLVEDDACPAGISGLIGSIERPGMTPSGGLFWMSALDRDANGSNDGKALFFSTDGTLANTASVLKSGDAVGPYAVRDLTLGLNGTKWAMSSDGAHYVALVEVDDQPSPPVTAANDEILVVDGTPALQENEAATGGTGNWDTVEILSINSAGDYIVTGDQTGDSTTDDFLAYNGTVAVAEGDDIGGVTLGEFVGAELTDSGFLAFWTGGTSEALFFSCDASDVANNAQLVLKRDDLLDTDGDGIGDFEVTDLNGTVTTGGGLALDDQLNLLLNVDLDGPNEAIIKLPVSCCGSGTVEGPEACDDGGESASCDVDCTFTVCGDLLVNSTAGEDCDEGGLDDSATCDADCTLPVCGDGYPNAEVGEACDDAGDSAACNADCTLASCGDFVVNAAADEDCDSGAVDSATCDADCTVATCGDAVSNAAAGEQCDDGGESAACDVDCTPSDCGDGLLNLTAGEQCEDGNDVDGDGCSSTCQIEVTVVPVCGDGVPEGGEACDEAGATSTCDADCTLPECGDGLVNQAAGEVCEDGNDVDGDGCSSTCTLEDLTPAIVCGDGVPEGDETCDDAGESATCDADCTAVACGDGLLNQTAGEQCEDGNDADGDGCSADCLLEQPTQTTEDGGGCACSASGGSGSPPSLLLLLGLVATRRRRVR